MDSRSLRIFLSVVEHGNISRAAAASHITQPALTKSLQRLENELGVKLFERSASGTLPTAFGRALVQHASTVVGDTQRLRDHMADMRTGRAGRVVIGAGGGILDTLVARATTLLHARLPGVRVTAIAGLTDELLPALQRGDLDLLIGSRPETFVDPAIACTDLFHDDIGIVVRKGHPLLRRQQLRLQDLRDQAWVLPGPLHAFTKSCIACFARQGLTAPPATVVSTSRGFIDSIVLNADFLTFMPLSFVATSMNRRGFATLDVPGSTWARTVVLFRRPEAPELPAISALQEALQSVVASDGSDLNPG